MPLAASSSSLGRAVGRHVARAEVVVDPVVGRRAVDDAEAAHPLAVELERHLAGMGAGVLRRRVLAEDDERHVVADRDLQRDREDRHVHRHRRRAEALERLDHERALDDGVDLEVDVVDAEADEVVEVRLAERRPGRRLPRDGQRAQAELEALDRLPRAVLAAADGQQAVVVGAARADAIDDLLNCAARASQSTSCCLAPWARQAEQTPSASNCRPGRVSGRTQERQ